MIGNRWNMTSNKFSSPTAQRYNVCCGVKRRKSSTRAGDKSKSDQYATFSALFWTLIRWWSDLVKVDGHGRVAHLWRLVVGSTHSGESHLCPSGAHRYAQRGGDGSVRRRVRVAHHETLPLQDNGLRVILADADHHAASQEEKKRQHGAGSRAARGHHGLDRWSRAHW